jgi:lysophospholipase L1-like esterase
MEKIINELVRNGINPIIQSTLYVSTGLPNWKKINKAVDCLNTGLKNICMENNIIFIDINKNLSIDGALRKEYSCDGIHLSGLGYKEWGKKITPIIIGNN